MKCRESSLLPSEVDAAVSGETSLDHESAARVVVTVRMTGTSKETYPADRCATAPCLSKTRNIGCCLVKRTYADWRAGCYSLTADDDAAAMKRRPLRLRKAPLSSAAAVGRPGIGLPVSFGVAARRHRPISTPDLHKQAYLRCFPYEPVAEIVQCGEPPPKSLKLCRLAIGPFGIIELPQLRKSDRATWCTTVGLDLRRRGTDDAQVGEEISARMGMLVMAQRPPGSGPMLLERLLSAISLLRPLR